MAYLIACLSTGKGSWSQLYRLIEIGQWEKAILITNAFGKEKFSAKPNTELVVLDLDAPTAELREKMTLTLRPLLSGQSGFSDVAVNLTSGTGKEHMALLSALFSLGVGIRFVDMDDKGIACL